MTLRIVPVTIAAGKAMSDGVDCSGSVRIVRIIMPPAWTFATLTFQMSPDGVGYHDLYHITPGATDPLKPYAVALESPTPDAVVAFPVNTGMAVSWIKLRSGTIATPVKQAAERVFQVVVEDASVVAGPTGPAGAAGVAGAKGATGPTGVFGPGVIDGSDAAVGQIGEVISSSNVGGVGLTTAVTMNVTQITLTPGDWNIGGVVIFTPVSTGPNSVIAALSQTAAALPSDNDVATGKGIMQQIWASSMPAGKTQTTPTSLIRINTSTAKTVYLVAVATFGGGTVTVTGYVSARRVR